MDEKQVEEIGRFVAKTAGEAEESAVSRAAEDTLAVVGAVVERADKLEQDVDDKLETLAIQAGETAEAKAKHYAAMAASGTEEQLEKAVSGLRDDMGIAAIEFGKSLKELQEGMEEALGEVSHELTAQHQEELKSLSEQLQAQTVFEEMLTKRLSEIKDGEKGDQGEQGEDGKDGLDRPLLEPIQLEDRDYTKNTLGTHSNGLWIATKDAQGDPSTDPHAWHCILDAMTEMAVDFTEGNEFTLSVKMATGQVLQDTFKIPHPTHEGIWEEGKTYLKDQWVTKGSSVWRALEDTDQSPPGNGWQQIIKAPRGPKGEKGESITGPQGKPGRNGRDAELPPGFIDEIRATASERKAFEDGRSDAYAITSHRGYFMPRETYRSGDVIDFDGSLYLCTAGGSWNKFADATQSFEPFVTIPKIAVANYMLWKGAYVSGKAYTAGYTVSDGPFTMVALRETTDTAAPIPEGDPIQVYPGADPTWSVEAHTGHIYSVFEVSVPSDGLYSVADLRVWVQGITSDDHYQVLSQDNDGFFTEIRSFDGDILGSPGWLSLNKGATFLTPGTVGRIWLHQWNSSAADSQTYPWTRGANNNANVDPGAGAWTTRNNLAQVRISYLDDEGADRESVVTDGGLIGSIVRMTQQDDANKWMDFVVNSINPDAGFVWYDTTGAGTGPSGEPDVGALCNINLKVPTVQSCSYVTLANHLSQFPSMQSHVSLDDPNTGIPSQDGVGIDVTFQSHYLSEDWEMVAYSGESAGTPSAGQFSEVDTAWIRQSSEPYFTAVVSTNNQAWTTIASVPLEVGESRKGIVNIDGRRTDGPGVFTGEFRVLAWNESGTVSLEQSVEIKLGDNRDIRAVANGGNMELQVQGKANQDWNWKAVVYYRDLYL